MSEIQSLIDVLAEQRDEAMNRLARALAANRVLEAELAAEREKAEKKSKRKK